MPTLTPSQRVAYDSFTAMWQQYGFNRPTATRIFCDLLGYSEVPYFMELDVAECERIKHTLRPKNLLEALAAAGKETGICQVCNRELTDPQSIAAGIGPVCGRRLTNPPRRTTGKLEDLLL